MNKEFRTRYLLHCAILICVTVGAAPAIAQASRPTPPTRDPHTPGYVQARQLPDGANAPADADGNFILGPTHNSAPEMSPQAAELQGTIVEFTMN